MGFSRSALSACCLLSIPVLLVGTPATAQTIADFTTIPNGNAPSFTLNGVTVSGSANVVSGVGASGNRGLGILGGGDNFTQSAGELLTIDYNQLVSQATVQIEDIPGVGNVTYAFTAFNGAANLGTFPVPAHSSAIETKDLTALSGGLSFTRVTFSISASPAVGLQYRQTTFTAGAAAPEPVSLALMGLAGIPLASTVIRRRRSV